MILIYNKHRRSLIITELTYLTNPGLVASYDIRPGKGSGLFHIPVPARCYWFGHQLRYFYIRVSIWVISLVLLYLNFVWKSNLDLKLAASTKRNVIKLFYFIYFVVISQLCLSLPWPGYLVIWSWPQNCTVTYTVITRCKRFITDLFLSLTF